MGILKSILGGTVKLAGKAVDNGVTRAIGRGVVNTVSKTPRVITHGTAKVIGTGVKKIAGATTRAIVRHPKQVVVGTAVVAGAAATSMAANRIIERRMLHNQIRNGEIDYDDIDDFDEYEEEYENCKMTLKEYKRVSDNKTILKMF